MIGVGFSLENDGMTHFHLGRILMLGWCSYSFLCVVSNSCEAAMVSISGFLGMSLGNGSHKGAKG